MKVMRKEFLKKLERVVGIVPKNPAFSTLAQFLLAGERDDITLTATNLETSYVGTLPAQDNDLSGARFTLPAHRLHRIIKELPGEEFEIIYENNAANIKAGRSSFKLPAGPAEDYPEIDTSDSRDYLATCNLSLVKSIINKTAFAVGHEEKRLDIIRLLFKENTIQCTAADGYRIADYRTAVNDSFSEAEEMILSSDSMAIIKTLAGDPDSPVAVYKQENMISLTLGDDKIFTRLREDAFPDTDNIIAEVDRDKEALLPTSETIKALKRTVLLSDETSATKLVFAPGKLNIYSESFNGNAWDQVEIDYSGDEHTVCFNARYLIDFLQTVSSERVRIYMPLLAQKAHMLAPEADEDHKYVVMPVSMTEDYPTEGGR